MKLTTKYLCLLAALALAVGLLSGLTATAYADDPVKVSYQEANYDSSTGKVTYTPQEATNPTAITAGTTTLTTGWYYVTGSVTVANCITVTGTANLILCDGATLTADNGIKVETGTLYIYAQSGGTGTLKATGGDGQAGIGGGQNQAVGTITIHGGAVTATGGAEGAGIGGGNEGEGGTVNIYGGTIEANGGIHGAGIGGGYKGEGGTVSIYGGTIEANGAHQGAGIGGGTGGYGTVNIYGGTVTAKAADQGAGIGGGNEGAGGTININGGNVTATGGSSTDGQSGAGIGGGNRGAGGTVNINGGTIEANGGSNGAGIGGGYTGEGGTVTINGGTVTANGGTSASGIGKGSNGTGDGTLKLNEELVVFGGESPETRTLIPDPQNNRHQYMLVSFLLSFDGNATDATGKMSDQLIGEVTLPENAFTRAGYTFKNWNTKADGTGESYADKATATFTTRTTLYAQWELITYTITYDLKGGSVSSANPTSYDPTKTFTLNNPDKLGYAFDGWTGTDLAEKTATVTIPAGSSGDRTYMANFTTISYTLSYDLDGGTNHSDNPSSYTIETATITLQAPTRDGYEFSGWTLDGETITEIPTGSTGDKTLTALWTAAETGGSALSVDVEVEALETSITANGESRTSAKTVFRNASGDTIVTANLAITTASDELQATVGTSFDTAVSVDVTLASVDAAYTNYAYSMDITGLPDWLEVSGEVVSSDNALKGSYHHEFILAGMPTVSSDSIALKFVAVVKISAPSSSADLTCSVDKTITLTSSSSDVSSNTPSPSIITTDPYASYGGNTGTQSNEGSDTTTDDNTETPADTGNDEPSDTGTNTQTPADTDNGVTEISSTELQTMTD